MKSSVLLILLLSVAGLAEAQEQKEVTTNFKDTVSVVRKDTSYWQKSFSGGINLNQASFSNWAGGGANSLAIGSVIAARGLYVKDKWSWDNTADLQLGYVTQRGVTRKASDQIFLNSVAGYKIGARTDAFLSGTFNSFFAPGYRYEALRATDTRLKVSGFFAPAQLTLAWGVAYKPVEWFSVRVSPFAPRLTFVTDNSVRVRNVNGLFQYDPTATAYGVSAGKTVRTELLALQLQATVTRNLTENVSLNARYQLFANYKTLDAIDHRLDLILTAKVSRYLSTTLGVILLYDKDFIDALQVQQSLAIGLSYNVSTFRKKEK